MVKFIMVMLLLSAWALRIQAEDLGRDMIVVTVRGATGDEQYEKKLDQVAAAWRKLCQQAEIDLLEVGGEQRGASGKDDREVLRGVLVSEIKAKRGELWLVLIGHGTFDGRESKFNMRGPDFTDAELGQWLSSYKGKLVVVNTASASGSFIKGLSGKNRVVITATKSAHEVFYPRFGKFFVEAIGGLEQADLDHDRQVSLLEAFLYAGHEVRSFYERERRIATEHALLDDNGDQRGVRAESFVGVTAQLSGNEKEGGGSPDGERAHQIYLLQNELEASLAEDLRMRRDELERLVKVLRRKRGKINEGLYYKQLEELLLEMARIYIGEGE
ncbi:MAG: hypothetical protein L3J39_14395 [Verrucomicrobiales bacterium]|nr:hypothetical protein [Verrucomicrobiales bacterium]